LVDQFINIVARKHISIDLAASMTSVCENLDCHVSILLLEM